MPRALLPLSGWVHATPLARAWGLHGTASFGDEPQIKALARDALRGPDVGLRFKGLRLARARTLLRARDVTRQGLPTIALTRLLQAGKLERVARGLYGLPGAAISEHRSLAEVSARVPKGVVCLLSALRVHEIGTQAPFEVWIAIPQHMVSPRLGQPAVRVVRMSVAVPTDGVDRLNIDGIDVPVFNAARTVVDCFRFRNKIGLDVALEALRDGWSQRKFTMNDLWRHATSGRVANVMRHSAPSWRPYSGLIVASVSSAHGRSKASRTLVISAVRIHGSLAGGAIAASARRTESSLTMPRRPRAMAATASPRTPAMWA